MNPDPLYPRATPPSATLLGLILGLAAGAAGALGGFGAFVLVLVFGVLGLLGGRYLDGQLDLSGIGIGRDRVDR